MKKVIMMAALLGSVSFVSKADNAKISTSPARKPLLLVHVVGCGIDTYLYGSSQAEIREDIQALKDAYCWAGQ